MARREVLIVDDHPIVHLTLSAIVRKAIPGAEVFAESNLPGALARAKSRPKLDLVLLDLGLPGCSGIESLLRVRRALPTIRVAVVSADDSHRSIREALDAGAAGYLPKTLKPSLMVHALRLIASGGTFVPQEAIGDTGRPPRPIEGSAPASGEAPEDSLTERQLQVLRLLLQGLGNREIARRLSISESTVKQHTHAVYTSLKVTTRAGAIVVAGKRGIRPE